MYRNRKSKSNPIQNITDIFANQEERILNKLAHGEKSQDQTDDNKENVTANQTVPQEKKKTEAANEECITKKEKCTSNKKKSTFTVHEVPTTVREASISVKSNKTELPLSECQQENSSDSDDSMKDSDELFYISKIMDIDEDHTKLIEENEQCYEDFKEMMKTIDPSAMDEDNTDIINDKIKSTKRSLTDSDNLHSHMKKMKIADDVKIEEPKPSQYLMKFAKYMDNKKTIKNLTFTDLEQFCLKKVCEVITHRSKEGEMYERIKKQEHTIATMGNTIEELVIDAQNLVIINNTIKNDLSQNSNQYPMLPVKITRTVGIQVNRCCSAE